MLKPSPKGEGILDPRNGTLNAKSATAAAMRIREEETMRIRRERYIMRQMADGSDASGRFAMRSLPWAD